MFRPRLSRRLLGLAGALCALLVAGTARANHFTVNLAEPVTFDGSFFNYNYTVTNNTLDTTYFVVSLSLLARPDAVEETSLVAPSGFQIGPFDPGVGLLEFLADTEAFDPGTTSGVFSFRSLFGPQNSRFEAAGIRDLGGPNEAGVTAVGTFVGPTVVPEPGTLALALPGLALLSLRRRNRR